MMDIVNLVLFIVIAAAVTVGMGICFWPRGAYVASLEQLALFLSLGRRNGIGRPYGKSGRGHFRGKK
jgi:hypothetical protein